MISTLAQRLHDIAGDLRAVMREHLSPEIKAELVAAEQALERAAACCESENEHESEPGWQGRSL